MILTVKHKFSLYRKFQIDIWGVFYTDIRAIKYLRKKLPWDKRKKLEFKGVKRIKSPYIRFFYKLNKKTRPNRKKRFRRYIYRLDILPVFRKYRSYNDRFVSVRVTRLYYLNYRDTQFRKLFKNCLKKAGNLEENYYYLLEGRLLSIFYRTNYIANIFELIKFIKDGRIYINFKKHNLLNTPVPTYKYITFENKYKKRFLYLFKRRLKAKAVLFNIPRFMFISYHFSYFYLYRLPKKDDLVYPIAIDAERLVNFH